MYRITLTLLFVYAFAFRAPGQHSPKGNFYGKLIYPRQVFHLVLHVDDSTLYVVGFRPNAIPVKDYRFDGVQLSFLRADYYSAYTGTFNATTNIFRGTWTNEEGKSTPLDFVPVDPDTIAGYPALTDASRQYVLPQAEEGIPACAASEKNVDMTMIDAFLAKLDNGDFGFVHSLLISRHGCLVYENYFYNFHGRMTFGIQSVTKSFVSALAGIAISRREINSVDDPLEKWVDRAYRPIVTDRLGPLTLHHVMSMTTGLEWDEVTYDYGDERNDLTKAMEQDPFRFLSDKNQITEKPFMYNSLNHSLMNMVLRNATGLSNEKEISRRLLAPLNINKYDLGDRDDYGLLGDIFIRPRDMLKFGMLYLDRGRFNGKQVIPADWIDISTTEKVRVRENLGYGYFWWTTTFRWKEKTVSSYFAWGYGGQYIFVVPEVGLVVVMNGTNWNTDPERYAREIMQDYVIPVCK